MKHFKQAVSLAKQHFDVNKLDELVYFIKNEKDGEVIGMLVYDKVEHPNKVLLSVPVNCDDAHGMAALTNILSRKFPVFLLQPFYIQEDSNDAKIYWGDEAYAKWSEGANDALHPDDLGEPPTEAIH